TRFLVIQTAFIGDVVLATALVESLAARFPDANIDFLLRKGNEGLLANNPHIRQVLIWNKKENKTRNLLGLLKTIRHNRYDYVINTQRYFSTGLLTAFSGAAHRIGFDKNPLSFLFTQRVKHVFDITHPQHETEKNQALIAGLCGEQAARPRLYPSATDYATAQSYGSSDFITMTPSSVWFTKKYPIEKWVELIEAIPENTRIYLLGGKDNRSECDAIIAQLKRQQVFSLAGELNFLQSAALMQSARMNVVNDSGPLHFASAMNAPTTAIFCSTIPAFGYYPLSDQSYIIETPTVLNCRPCGIHGKKACPHRHFRCGYDIQLGQFQKPLMLPA
ncbi:MAG TPA: glycosyltransferase family 9 protein, partial [Ferruginibacter sp.]|nr:glycosyltransferase family 9 protein [Ferruginibacter sp.]